MSNVSPKVASVETLTENQKVVECEITDANGVVTKQSLTIDVSIQKEFREVSLMEAKVGSKYCKVARYLQVHKTATKVLINTLLSLGKTMASANSIASRIKNLAKPENEELLKLMEKGEVGEREARIIIAGNQVRKAPASKESLMIKALLSAANYAVSENFDLARFIAEATKAYEIETNDKQDEANKRALAAQQVATKAAAKEITQGNVVGN